MSKTVFDKKCMSMFQQNQGSWNAQKKMSSKCRVAFRHEMYEHVPTKSSVVEAVFENVEMSNFRD